MAKATIPITAAKSNTPATADPLYFPVGGTRSADPHIYKRRNDRRS
jgi:hypothetical protein